MDKLKECPWCGSADVEAYTSPRGFLRPFRIVSRVRSSG